VNQARAIIESGATDRVYVGNGIWLEALAGKATRGKTIEVGGISLTLPADAYIERYELGGHGGGQPGAKMLEYPIYGIARGNGLAAVSKATGEFQIIAGPREPFRFLIDTLGPVRELPYATLPSWPPK
jgi:hypothetical protein